MVFMGMVICPWHYLESVVPDVISLFGCQVVAARSSVVCVAFALLGTDCILCIARVVYMTRYCDLVWHYVVMVVWLAFYVL